MERGLESAEKYRATALLCRQQAACDPDKSWRLLGEAERWEYLAEQISACRHKNRQAESSKAESFREGAKYAGETGMPDVAPSPPDTVAARSRAPPSKPPRYG